MPGLDGIQVLRRLQESGGCCRHVPVFIITAFRKDFFEPLQQAAADGLQFDIADKPLTVEQIQALVRTRLEGSERSQER
jgi:CheY-like chemotaxis protein